MAMSEAKKKELKGRRAAPLITPSDLGAKASANIAGGMNAILADVWALYFKTKNYHWHMSGPHFRDYHLLFDEQAGQILSSVDDLAERVRKIGGTTVHSIGEIAKLQSIKDNNADAVSPEDMLRELMRDNDLAAASMRKAHEFAERIEDVATVALLETLIDAAERRSWFLSKAGRSDHKQGSIARRGRPAIGMRSITAAKSYV